MILWFTLLKASVSIRKGKQILCYEFDCNIEFSVDEHKGSIHVTSKVGKGTEFKISLPIE